MKGEKEKQALAYHANPVPGKLEINPTKPCNTSVDLSLAYSPGVAIPCLEIADKPEDVYKYTSKGNLVAVISNGTAVLGLGDIGPAASKPVMEGKAILFKRFAGIDVFDLEINECDPEKLVDIITALHPTFGGINLEDIKAPECFVIEEALKERIDIPVFHDDQHGTAIIASAAVINALELTGKSISEIKLVINGAGASAISCAGLLLKLGMKKEQIVMCDSRGVIWKGRRDGMNPWKEKFATDLKHRTLEEAMVGADMFFGLSKGNVVSPKMLLSMAHKPIVFAMANPTPEIDYDLAIKTRDDIIMATGRSDFPNQVNNVLGFPFIFRGALDVHAISINEEMKLAATHALAQLAREPVPQQVREAYGNEEFSFGPNYLIPKPFDTRVLHWVSPAVAEAAIKTGVARKKIDVAKYRNFLQGKRHYRREMILGRYYGMAKKSNKKKIAFAEGDNPRVLCAAKLALDQGIAQPVLIGDEKIIKNTAKSSGISLEGIDVIDPKKSNCLSSYAIRYEGILKKRGKDYSKASKEVSTTHVFANLMLDAKRVDGVISGIDRRYPVLIRSTLDIIGVAKDAPLAAGLYIVSIQERLLFFTDVSINRSMNSEKLASIAFLAEDFVSKMGEVPSIAMLSFSNFGSVKHDSVDAVQKAIKLVKSKKPDLLIDGEMQVDAALMYNYLVELNPKTPLPHAPNILIFPDMQSANIAYKFIQKLAGALIVGPIILGLRLPSYVMQRHASEDEIFNMTTVAVAQASLHDTDAR